MNRFLKYEVFRLSEKTANHHWHLPSHYVFMLLLWPSYMPGESYDLLQNE
jgi:hypothetical protein